MFWKHNRAKKIRRIKFKKGKNKREATQNGGKSDQHRKCQKRNRKRVAKGEEKGTFNQRMQTRKVHKDKQKGLNGKQNKQIEQELPKSSPKKKI